MLKGIIVALAAVAFATGAQAQSFNANFDSENGGASSLNYTGFSNFTVVGQVDLVHSPDYGITCAGGSGSCVDLDGTSGPGSLTTDPIAFVGGQLINVSFMVSGNQRNAGPDNFLFDSVLTGATGYDFFCGTGFTVCTSGTYNANTFGPYSESYDGDRGFTTYAFSFRPNAAGTLTLSFGTDSADNVGPILDNVSVNAAVPEVATWAMMILGFGLVGAALRGRQRISVRYA